MNPRSSPGRYGSGPAPAGTGRATAARIHRTPGRISEIKTVPSADIPALHDVPLWQRVHAVHETSGSGGFS